ncbi:hypothetical protein PUN28_011663 [Cardiocondyla obscurior]|uniref:Secreted protein n=1 Tax=Cardiocondyla obscurior TaxID=286306 RepID=A0AAW2FJI9_9HYME
MEYIIASSCVLLTTTLFPNRSFTLRFSRNKSYHLPLVSSSYEFYVTRKSRTQNTRHSRNSSRFCEF